MLGDSASQTARKLAVDVGVKVTAVAKVLNRRHNDETHRDRGIFRGNRNEP
jgi:hypothetical protein